MSDGPRIAVCPGTFDPPTLGHIDIITRAARLFERLIVGVVETPNHKRPLFSTEQRAAMLRDALADHDGIEVQTFSTLAVEFARSQGASVLVKGLRTAADLELETTMARINTDLAPAIETVFLVCAPQFAHVSSSGVRELAAYGADVSGYVPPLVAERLAATSRA